MFIWASLGLRSCSKLSHCIIKYSSLGLLILCDVYCNCNLGDYHGPSLVPRPLPRIRERAWYTMFARGHNIFLYVKHYVGHMWLTTSFVSFLHLCLLRQAQAKADRVAWSTASPPLIIATHLLHNIGLTTWSIIREDTTISEGGTLLQCCSYTLTERVFILNI